MRAETAATHAPAQPAQPTVLPRLQRLDHGPVRSRSAPQAVTAAVAAMTTFCLTPDQA